MKESEGGTVRQRKKEREKLGGSWEDSGREGGREMETEGVAGVYQTDLHKIETDDWRPKPFEASHEVRGSRRDKRSGSINCSRGTTTPCMYVCVCVAH